MRFWKPKPQDQTLTEIQNKIEILAHKKATKKQVEKVKRVNDTLNDLFVDNNFTLKIYLARRGH